jgi:hypothetical protein
VLDFGYHSSIEATTHAPFDKPSEFCATLRKIRMHHQIANPAVYPAWRLVAPLSNDLEYPITCATILCSARLVPAITSRCSRSCPGALRRQMKLAGMADTLAEQRQTPDLACLEDIDDRSRRGLRKTVEYARA